MSANKTAANWIRAGLLALPIYGLLTAWSTIDPQPDQAKDPAAWARFVGSDAYLVDHVVGAIGGAVLAILGVFALGALLAGGRAGRLGLTAMVITVVGHALGLAIGGVATFATNAIGRAYLAGTEDVMQVEFSGAMSLVFAAAILFMFVGNVLLGVAVWRSGILPKWAGALWVASTVLFYLLGAVLGMATTGSSLPTQPVAGSLMAISGAWIALSILRRPSTESSPGLQAQASVQ